MCSKVINKFIDPLTKTPLDYKENGNLYNPTANQQIEYKNQDGIYDFVVNRENNSDKEYYENFYNRDSSGILLTKDFQKAWKLEPGFQQLLNSLGNISGKKILLLGNGISLKELYFLRLGAKCVYTDLSINSVKFVKSIFERSELKDNGFDQIEFHAVNACYLPFPDESFDIIYGCAFVHHVEKLNDLFMEINRCLKPGGICRFRDHAYSPLWMWLKNNLLKPIQIYVHNKRGISPADLRATKRGGYKKDELEQLKNNLEFKEILYYRLSFFDYLLQRGTLKLGGRFLRILRPLMKALDRFLDKTIRLEQKHGIVLIWGFKK